jgi:hypothetical protein
MNQSAPALPLILAFSPAEKIAAEEKEFPAHQHPEPTR